MGEDVASAVGDLQTRWAVDLSRKGPAAKMMHPRCKKLKKICINPYNQDSWFEKTGSVTMDELLVNEHS